MATQKLSMDEVLAKLRSFIESMKPTRTTILEFATTSFEKDQGQVGYAFLKHAQDILHEAPNLEDVDLMVECYRRVFFVKEFAEQYGTEHFLMKTPQQASQMVENMILQHECAERGSPVQQEPPGCH
jgi:phage-related protein